MFDKTGNYNCFAGRESSHALACMEFDKVHSRAWRDCSKEDLERLEDWVSYFSQRYKKIGYLDEEFQKSAVVTSGKKKQKKA